MGTFHVTARIKADSTNGGMKISNTVVAVNSAGTFRFYRENVQGNSVETAGVYAFTIQAPGPDDGAAPTITDLSGDETLISLIAATAGNDIVIPGSTTYIVNAAIAIPSGKTLRAATGTSVTIKADSAYAGHIFTMTNCVGSSLKNVTIDGNWANRSAQEAATTTYALQITGGSGNTIEACEFMNLPSTGIWEFSSGNLTVQYNKFTEVYLPIRIDASNITATACSIIGNNFTNTNSFKSINGVQIINANDPIIKHNTFQGQGLLEPTTHGFEGTWGNSIYTFKTRRLLIENNTCLSAMWSAIVVGQSSFDATVLHNTIHHGVGSGSAATTTALWFEQGSASGINIAWNNITGGILVGDEGGNSVSCTDNVINTSGVGIDVSFFCTHGTFARNTITRLGTQGNNGVFLWEKRPAPIDVRVENNTIDGFSRGVFINNSLGAGTVFGLTIQSNTIQNCTSAVSVASGVSVDASCSIQGITPAPAPAPAPAPSPAPAPAPAAPVITTARHPKDLLQVGNSALDTYFVEDNRWRATDGGYIPAIRRDTLPNKVLGVYWEAYRNTAAFPLTAVPQRFNVVWLFHCRFNSDGTLYFDWTSDVPASHVQTLRNRGQKVILTVGGGGFGFIFANRTQSTNFINSFQTFYNQFGGVDGCDFNNYEQAVLGATFYTEMKWIGQQLKSLYGSSFIITTPPEANDADGYYRTLCREMISASCLDLVMPQYYDWVAYKNTDFIRDLNNNWVSSCGVTRTGLGLPSNWNEANGPSLSEGLSGWDKCVAVHPNMRGVFAWSAHWNNLVGDPFSPAHYTKLSAAAATSTYAIAEGSATSQFSQRVERGLSAGSNGEVSARFQWRWPTSVGGVLVDGNPTYQEVKGFPALVYGKKPGFAGSYRYPAAFEKVIRLPDAAVVTAAPAGTPFNIQLDWVASGGSVSTTSPSGGTPGGDLPKQLPLSTGTLLATGFYSMSATGKAQLTFDIWLQDPANSAQTAGFANSPVTHQIMIPLRNFGNYGAHGVRNPNWYDHDVTIDGVTYHVYCTKNLGISDVTGNTTSTASTAGLRYNFGTLYPNFTNEETTSPRIGWKLIVFQHDGASHPLQADGSFSVDISKFLNHLSTRTDSRGTQFARGTEHVVSCELGVEMVVGEGDCTIWNYRVRVPA